MISLNGDLESQTPIYRVIIILIYPQESKVDPASQLHSEWHSLPASLTVPYLGLIPQDNPALVWSSLLDGHCCSSLIMRHIGYTAHWAGVQQTFSVVVSDTTLKARTQVWFARGGHWVLVSSSFQYPQLFLASWPFFLRF